jgi:hypothetical protein
MKSENNLIPRITKTKIGKNSSKSRLGKTLPENGRLFSFLAKISKSESIAIFVIPVFCYLILYFYYLGYFSYFNIPDSFMIFEPTKFLGLVSILGLPLAINGFLIINSVTSFLNGKNLKKRIEYGIISVYLIVSVFFTTIEEFYIFYLLNLIIILAFIIFFIFITLVFLYYKILKIPFLLFT